MNYIKDFLPSLDDSRNKCALIMPGSPDTNFNDLIEYALKTQVFIQKSKFKPGDYILIASPISPVLYGCILGLISSGCPILFIEPWMSLEKINKIIDLVKPKLFLSNFLGKMWGLRIKEIRHIPIWKNIYDIISEESISKSKLHIEDVPDNHIALLSFTSGTSGYPKGVLRDHGFLKRQLTVLNKYWSLNASQDIDLCIFPNFALANLASCKTTFLISPRSKKIGGVIEKVKPSSLTCSPAFLENLMSQTQIQSFKTIHIGGALVDCKLYQKAFSHWPSTDFIHVYGSTEAEPVTLNNARKSLERSLEKGYEQVLFLGEPVLEITPQLEEDSLWISGPHVSSNSLLFDDSKNYKKKDHKGNIWHNMGDRIIEDKGWWYDGRSHQLKSDFKLEQRIYSFLGETQSFLFRDKYNDIHLIGVMSKKNKINIKENFKEIKNVIPIKKIIRDNRHHSRIDRAKNIEKYCKCLIG
jgi:acyl-coenzyme A synthetase/AMP-(fatty) acid ligase